MLITDLSVTSQRKSRFSDFQETPLRVASENGYVEVVKCLLENGANINGKNRLGVNTIKVK